MTIKLKRRRFGQLMISSAVASVLANLAGKTFAQEQRGFKASIADSISERTWWKESVVYQIYPRSFKDSNGDGVGDLRGIIQKLDYLKYLGVDVVWLCPIYPSPNVDYGYDVSDYTAINPEFGTIDDFDELLPEMKKRNLKLVMDLVFNHSSTQHPWFVQARKSKDNPYRNYYIWREGKNGQPPNDWPSTFGGSAWTYNEATGDYYLHLFTPQQADLNWEYEPLRRSLYKVMRFWLDKGIDGFRMDVISYISKKPGFPPRGNDKEALTDFYANGPKVHDYLQEMHREVLSRYDVMSVGEAPGVTVDLANLYVGKNRHELNMIFQFEHTSFDNTPEGFSKPISWKLSVLKEVFTRWDALSESGWNSIYLGNHDLPRQLSRLGNDREYRVVSAKLLATLLLTLRGTPYIYQGDEIGMTNCPFRSIEEFRDIMTLDAYKAAMKKGESLESFLASQNKVSRDHARTLMQWESTTKAGFTSGKPWIKVNSNYQQINVARSISDENSVLNYYKKLIGLRKQKLVLVYGDYQLLMVSHPDIYAYLRNYKGEKVLVLLNFSANTVTFDIPSIKPPHENMLILSNYHEGESVQSFVLRPYEAKLYNLKPV